LLVSDNNIEAMTLQINRIFIEPNLANKLTENAKESIKSFDWDMVKKQWKDLLR
jgi:glycosyltransferase involved in cell wall biosynthesis